MKLKEISFYVDGIYPKVKIVHYVGQGVHEVIDLHIQDAGIQPEEITALAKRIADHAKEVK